jgi:hypothetical protein
MARVSGDKNYSEREHRLVAENEVLKAKIAASKAEIKVLKLRKKEVAKRV